MRTPTLYRLMEAKQRRGLVGLGLLVILAALLEAAAVTAIYPFLLVATAPSGGTTAGALARLQQAAGLASTSDFLFALGAAILVVVIASNLVGAYTVWRHQRFVRGFEHSVSVRMLRHFLYQPYPYFLANNTAEIQRRLQRDPREVSEGALEPALDLLQRGTIAVAIFAVLLVAEPGIALAAVAVFGGIYLLFYRSLRRRLHAAGERLIVAYQTSAKASAEALNAIKMLKLTGREEHFVAHYSAAEAIVSRSRAKHAMYTRTPRYVVEGLTFVFLMGTVLTIFASGRALLSMLPVLGMFAFAGLRLMPAVHGMVASAGRLKYGQPIVDGIARELEGPLPRREEVEPLRFLDDIRFENVQFAYDGSGRTALQGIDVHVPRGTSLGIVGKTGSGKTTILDLLLGLLEPTSGVIRVDGHPIAGGDVARWQRSVSYVPQQVVLLDDTIARNIAFGLPDESIDMERVRAAAAAANVGEFIEHELPLRYETVVGERGVRLSGGQRQRIGIARALYEDREVIVFDEATSEVDPVTERVINAAIHAVAGRKTVVVVAHRFSAIRDCDRILLLENGRAVATGSYGELLGSASSFRHLAEAAQL